MAATLHILEDTFAYLDAATAKYFLDGAAAVVGALQGPATALVTLYVVLWGIAMMTGKVAEPVMDGAIRIVKSALIIAFATNSALYAGEVADFLYKWPAALVGVINGSEITSTTQILDQSLAQSIDLGKKVWESATITTIGLYFIALAIWTMGAVVAGLTAFIIITAKIGLALLLAIGPIFILLLMFDATREFFNKWLTSVLSTGFTIVLVSMVSQLIMKYYSAGIEAANASAGASGGIVAITTMMPAVVTGIIAIPMILSIPSLASGLGGGVSAGTAGIAGFAYNKIKGATGTTLLLGGKTSAATGRMAGKGIKAAYNRVRNRGNFGQGQGQGQGGSIQGAPLAVYRKITSGTRRRAA